jgi:hypothetical protein
MRSPILGGTLEHYSLPKQFKLGQDRLVTPHFPLSVLKTSYKYIPTIHKLKRLKTFLYILTSAVKSSTDKQQHNMITLLLWVLEPCRFIGTWQRFGEAGVSTQRQDVQEHSHRRGKVKPQSA